MNFSVNKRLMLSQVKAAGKVILAKNTLPILDCIRVELDDCQMLLTAGDGQNTLTLMLAVEQMSGPATFCINGRQLEAALSALDGELAEFDVEEKSLTLHAEKEHYNIPLESADEYPLAPQTREDSSRYTIDSSIIGEACRLAKPFVANDELRPVMNGILFESSPEGITFVATDGHKMMRRIYKEVKSEERSSIIVPLKTASLLATFPPMTEVTVTSDGHCTVFEGGDIRLSALCIEGRYPNYNSVIPTTCAHTVEVERTKLSKAVADVGSFGSLASNLIKLRMTTFMGGATEMEVSAQDIDFSTSAAKSVPAVHSAPENFSIGLKGDFLRTLLASHSSPSVTIEMTDPSRAIVMRDKTPAEGIDMLTLLMPMMLNE